MVPNRAPYDSHCTPIAAVHTLGQRRRAPRPKTLLAPCEVAAILGVSRRTLQKLGVPPGRCPSRTFKPREGDARRQSASQRRRGHLRPRPHPARRLFSPAAPSAGYLPDLGPVTRRANFRHSFRCFRQSNIAAIGRIACSRTSLPPSPLTHRPATDGRVAITSRMMERADVPARRSSLKPAS